AARRTHLPAADSLPPTAGSERPARTSIQPHGPMQSPEAGRLPAQVAEIGRLTERCCPDADLPAVHELAGGGRESQGWRERCCAPWLPYCSAGFVPRCA